VNYNPVIKMTFIYILTMLIHYWILNSGNDEEGTMIVVEVTYHIAG
jgi:hypothetical protein